MTTLTRIDTCAATSCAYNHDGCAAPAVTIGGNGVAASCTTFITLDARGGLPVASGQVGACQRLECTHNTDLMCTSATISLTGDTANCASYSVR